MTPARKAFVLTLGLPLGLTIGVFTLFRLWYIQSGILDLAADEAQYWDWSRHLDLSYYSKGPFIAWFIGFFTGIGGDTVFFVRLGAVLCALGTSVLFYLITWRMTGSEKTALYSATALQVVPLFSAGGVLMTIDPPLILLWSLAVYSLCLVFFEDKPGWWYGFGIFLGLGMLAKYAMAYILLGLFFFIVLSAPRRFWLKRKEPWLACLIALLIFSPVIYWNYKHGWVAARHVAGQVPDVEGGGVSLANMGEFIGSQAGILSPLIFIGVIYGLYMAARRAFREKDEGMLFLFAFSGPILIMMTVLSLKGKMQANWAAPTYFTAAVATAAILSKSTAVAATRAFLSAALILAAIMSTVAYNTDMLRVAGIPWNPHKDPTSRLKGWRELGDAASEVRRSMGELDKTFVLSDRYQISSEMAFYMEGQPRTYNVNLGRRMNQFNIWGGLEKQVGKDAVLVFTGRGYFPVELKDAFERHEIGKSIIIRRAGWDLHTYTIFRCYGFKGYKEEGSGKY